MKNSCVAAEERNSFVFCNVIELIPSEILSSLSTFLTKVYHLGLIRNLFYFEEDFHYQNPLTDLICKEHKKSSNYKIQKNIAKSPNTKKFVKSQKTINSSNYKNKKNIAKSQNTKKPANSQKTKKKCQIMK